MGRIKFRRVKEIYATTVEVVLPENPELAANNGPGEHADADAAEQVVELNGELPVIEEQQNPSEEIRTRQESRARGASSMLSEKHASAAEGTEGHKASMSKIAIQCFPVVNSSDRRLGKAVRELSHEVPAFAKRLGKSVVSSLKGPYIEASSSKVRTCDVCGDFGWDDCLATCSRCRNGAEHIYCMRLKLAKVPEGNWLCQDCTVAVENEKKRQDESAKKRVQGSSSCQRKDSGTSDSVKKTVDSSKILPVKKRRSLRKADGRPILSKSCSEAAEDCSIESWLLGEAKADSTSQGVESNQQESGAEKICVEKGAVICDDEKEGPVHIVSSFKNSMSVDGKVVDSQVKKPYSEFPQAENSNRTYLAKILSLAGDRNWHRNLVRPPVIQTGASTAQRSGQTPVQGEPVLAVPPGFKHHDIRDVRGDGRSKEPSKSNSEAVFSVPPASKHRDIAMKFVEKMSMALVIIPSNLIAAASSGVHPRPDSMWGITSAVQTFPAFPIDLQSNFIWQGGFEVMEKGVAPTPFDGMQAHLSTRFAHKFRERAEKLPQKFLVEKVPLKGVRPSHFKQNLTKEFEIALYFFARDVESWDTNYKNLMIQMITGDFALRGNVDGVDLVIFTSNLLPENAQRWNGLLFLWGVFTAMKPRNSRVLSKPLSITGVFGVRANPSGSLPSPQSSGMLPTSNTLLYNVTPKAPGFCISSEKLRLTSGGLRKTSGNEIPSPQSRLSGMRNADEQLRVVVSVPKTVQPSGDLRLKDILPRGTTGGKRRAETELDLLASQETSDKRLKSHLEMFQHNRKPRFSSAFKRVGSGKDPRLDRALTIGPVFRPPQADSMKGRNASEPEILNLDLSIGTDTYKALQVSDEQKEDECSISRSSNESDDFLNAIARTLLSLASSDPNKGSKNNKM